MQVEALGHAVLKVRSLEQAEAFYTGVLGIPIATRHEEAPMTFFTLGNHHDLALLEVGEEAPSPPAGATGLYHVAFKIGESLDELRAARDELEAAGVSIDSTVDHAVSQSLYIRDPDGNGIELYVDGSDVWRSDPSQVARGEPLQL